MQNLTPRPTPLADEEPRAALLHQPRVPVHRVPGSAADEAALQRRVVGDGRRGDDVGRGARGREGGRAEGAGGHGWAEGGEGGEGPGESQRRARGRKEVRVDGVGGPVGGDLCCGDRPRQAGYEPREGVHGELAGEDQVGELVELASAKLAMQLRNLARIWEGGCDWLADCLPSKANPLRR